MKFDFYLAYNEIDTQFYLPVDLVKLLRQRLSASHTEIEHFRSKFKNDSWTLVLGIQCTRHSNVLRVSGPLYLHKKQRVEFALHIPYRESADLNDEISYVLGRIGESIQFILKKYGAENSAAEEAIQDVVRSVQEAPDRFRDKPRLRLRTVAVPLSALREQVMHDPTMMTLEQEIAYFERLRSLPEHEIRGHWDDFCVIVDRLSESHVQAYFDLTVQTKILVFAFAYWLDRMTEQFEDARQRQFLAGMADHFHIIPPGMKEGESMPVSIREILQRPGGYQGWLYLPAKPWNLETSGVFVVLDKDAPPHADPRPDIVKADSWTEVLDAQGIEDIVENACAQLVAPTIYEMLTAFLFYVEHDAFIVFEQHWAERRGEAPL